MRKKDVSSSDQILKEFETIKRLLALMLIKAGASQDELGIALQLDRSGVSRMLPSSKIKPFNS
jgi:hypothetical protein